MRTRHVLKYGTQETWCGVEITGWFFTSIDQAAVNTEPICKKCAAAIIECLKATRP